MSKEFKVVCAVSVVLLIGIWACYPYTSAGTQAKNMEQAEHHIPILQAVLDENPRFREVRLAPSTDGGGSLSVYGAVRTKTDFQGLVEAIKSTSPRMPVAVMVRIPGGADDVTDYWLVDGQEGQRNTIQWPRRAFP